MENHQFIRCPKCGGMHLEGIYEKPLTFWEAFFKTKTIWGLYKALKTEPAAHWQCIDCGNTFPMK